MGFLLTAAGNTTTSASDDPFETVSNFFSSGTWEIVQLVVQAFVVLMWLALVWWTYQDARRRIREPALIAGAVALSVLIPYLGSLIYLVIRPPEYLVEARERELELMELERRLQELGDSEGQRMVGRILARERGGDPDDPAVRSELRRAGLATREELQDLDLRLTEIEFRLRNNSGSAAPARSDQTARATRVGGGDEEARPRATRTRSASRDREDR